MILPLGVDDLQHDVALDALQHFAADQLFLSPRRPRRTRSHSVVADFVRRSVARSRAPAVSIAEDPGRPRAAARRDPTARSRPPRRRRSRPGASSTSSARSNRYSRVPTTSSSSSSRILPFENLAAQRVDVLALLVHHVVVLEEVLADREVLRLDLLLRALDGPRHHAVLDRHAFFHAELLHQAGDAIRPEDAHQVVLEREVEAGRARDRPGGRRGRAAGCRCGVPRGARCRRCAGRRAPRPRRARRRSAA